MEEVLDLLMSFVDFQAFKDLMLAHKMETTSKPMQVGNPNQFGRPYRDAQDRQLWRDKTCPARPSSS